VLSLPPCSDVDTAKKGNHAAGLVSRQQTDADKDELFKQIGQLKMELDLLD
jgi:hypothetical protein